MTRWMLGWILDGSWIDFWWILGPSWEVSWGQVGTKIRQHGAARRCQKIITNLEAQGSGRKSVSWPLKTFQTQVPQGPRGQYKTLETLPLGLKARGRIYIYIYIHIKNSTHILYISTYIQLPSAFPAPGLRVHRF